MNVLHVLLETQTKHIVWQTCFQRKTQPRNVTNLNRRVKSSRRTLLRPDLKTQGEFDQIYAGGVKQKTTCVKRSLNTETLSCSAYVTYTLMVYFPADSQLCCASFSFRLFQRRRSTSPSVSRLRLRIQQEVTAWRPASVIQWATDHWLLMKRWSKLNTNCDKHQVIKLHN